MSWLNRLWDILRRKLPSREKLIEAVPLILDLRLRAKNCARYTVYLYPLKLSESG